MEIHTEAKEIGNLEIPKQIEGSEMNVIEETQFKSRAEAITFYNTVKKRLTAINSWASISNLSISTFKLFDCAGRAVEREAIVGDFIRIDIPGPGTRIGKVYDWVRIEALVEEHQEDSDAISLRVRPSHHPLSNDKDVAHFLKSCATSTFQVKRIGVCVLAAEHGRNEVANLGSIHILDNIRNGIVSAGAMIGFSYPQWKSLVSGLLSKT